MDQVAAKCYLGLAIEEVIEELGLEKKSKKILDAYFESFKQYYEQFKKHYTNENSKVDGKLAEHFEYPIGDKENLQYYLAYGEMSFSMAALRHTKGELPTMLEGFSTNEGAKVRTGKKSKKSGLKGQGEFGRKRKNV